MTARAGRGNSGARGFASMDEERKKRIASQGGLASAKGNKTANRGFASMDRNKQREISSMGGKASRNTSQEPKRNEENAERKDSIRVKDASISEFKSLDKQDEPETGEKAKDSLANSETDVDEDEGLGDGKLGRSIRGGVYGK